MERHWNDDVEATITQSFVIQRRAQPMRNEITQINLVTVLEPVNDLAHNPAAAICRHRCVEMDSSMSTVGASKCTGDRAFEWLGALLAKRRDDADGFSFALVAEIFTSTNICSADRANRRIEKRYERI